MSLQFESVTFAVSLVTFWKFNKLLNELLSEWLSEWLSEGWLSELLNEGWWGELFKLLRLLNEWEAGGWSDEETIVGWLNELWFGELWLNRFAWLNGLNRLADELFKWFRWFLKLVLCWLANEADGWARLDATNCGESSCEANSCDEANLLVQSSTLRSKQNVNLFIFERPLHCTFWDGRLVEWRFRSLVGIAAPSDLSIFSKMLKKRDFAEQNLLKFRNSFESSMQPLFAQANRSSFSLEALKRRSWGKRLSKYHRMIKIDERRWVLQRRIFT